MQHTGKITAYLHASKDMSNVVKFNVFPCDMSGFGHTLVTSKEFEVSFDIPEDFSIELEELKALKAEKQKMMANHHIALMGIDEKIQRLLALEYNPE